jgi:hypothetical protein
VSGPAAARTPFGRGGVRLEPRAAAALALLGGIAAVAIAMAAGLVGDLPRLIAEPPTLVRAALVGVTVVVGLALLGRALRGIESARRNDVRSPSGFSDSDLATMIRAVRYVFLAAACLCAAVGWLVGHPLPLVVALVIAGVDVVETSLLLLVATSRR